MLEPWNQLEQVQLLIKTITESQTIFTVPVLGLHVLLYHQ